MICHLCDGRETIESAVRYQLIAEQAPDKPQPFVALCKRHLAEAEGAYRAIKRIQTGPVTINLPGLCIGGATGRN
jgi:hypothetical protein